MSNVLALHAEQITKARAIRARLWNPPNGRKSSELEIVTTAEMKKRELAKAELVRAQERLRREALAEQRISEIKERMRNWVASAGYEEMPDLDMRQRSSVEIIDKVCAHFNASPIDMISGRRSHDCTIPRHTIMYLLKKHTTLSLPVIGKKLGGRDHTTVLYGVRKIQELIDAGDPRTLSDISTIRRSMGLE